MTATAPAPTEYELMGLIESGCVGDLLAGIDQKQGRIRLQALISEWRRVDRIGNLGFRRRKNHGQSRSCGLRDH